MKRREPLPRSFYDRNPVVVAKDLLGKPQQKHVRSMMDKPAIKFR